VLRELKRSFARFCRWPASPGPVCALSLAFVAAGAAGAAPRFGDWELGCEGQGPCVIAQSVMAGDRSWLATVMMQPEPAGARVQVVVPAGVHLASGLYLQQADAAPLAARWLACSPETCRADLRLAAGDLDDWKKGRAAQIRYRARLDGPVVAFDLSLMGITAALDAAGERR